MKLSKITLEKLLSYNDENFIRHAYISILDREPDQEGFEYFLSLLKNKVRKIKILIQFRYSQEGLERNVPIAGLEFLKEKQRWLRLPLIGKLIEYFVVKSTNAVATVDEISNYSGKQFIEVAYQTLLQREPDMEGLNSYLVRLRKGMNKTQILVNIRISKEGKTKAVKIANLRKAIFRYQLVKTPFFGRIIDFFWHEYSRKELQKKLFALETEVNLVKTTSLKEELFMKFNAEKQCDQLNSISENSIVVFNQMKSFISAK